MSHTVFFTRISSIALAALLTACGGGGGGDTTGGEPVNPQVPSSPVNSGIFFEVPLQNAIPQHSYNLDSPESHAFDKLNRARTECGFGAMTQDTRLDKMAQNHARYLLAENFPYQGLSHVETNKSNQFYTGEQPWDRAKHVGFLTNEVNYNGVGEDLSGGVLSTSMMDNRERVARYLEVLLSAPYHAMDILTPRTQVGLSFSWHSNSGLQSNMTSDTTAIVAAVSPGSPTTTDQKTQIYQWPVDDILTWPCNGTSNILPTHMQAEAPEYFADGRDYGLQPAGTPFYVVARHGSNLRITSQKLTQIESNVSVPLLEPRYGDKELYPGTKEINTSAKLMDWAFIMPDVPLEDKKRYRMEVTAVVNGKTVQKSVEFTPTNNFFE